MLTKRVPLCFLRRVSSSPKYFRSAKSDEASPSEKYQALDSPNSSHQNLASFLDYADRIQLDRKSPVYVGTLYEYTVKCALEKLGMNLKRIGGRDDYGTDIIGTWALPSAPQKLKVLVQCKAHAGKLSPAHVRELEGAFSGVPVEWRGPGALGLLVSQNPSSKGVREALGRSRWPLGFTLCDADGKIRQMIWNNKADQQGLAGIQVSIQYSENDKSGQELVLTWMGKVICP
ncbi:hypothetical protein K3495_g4590 [Podosphaera aphanis]|nr:hypothetical protein K3495_g4590 [Podosphaera aphanis]